MKSKLYLLIGLLVMAAMVLSACQPQQPATATTSPETEEAPAETTWGPEPVIINGDLSYSNDFVLETYLVEQAVTLMDMHGFVIRNFDWELPVNSQVMGYLAVDKANNTGAYHLALPIKPEGEFNDVDNNGNADTGVQIFTVAYNGNIAGGPYSEGDDKSYGWPTYIASTIASSEKNSEVVGGKLVIWAPDDAQQFPTGFGDDGLLFTADDPVGPVPAGWSIIDLDQAPFTIIREEEPSVTLYEPIDFAIKDYSAMTYTEAFNEMFNTIKEEYAFNDVPGKAPVWDDLYAQILPMVEEAEANADPEAYFMAIKEYTNAFNDGHVGVSADVENNILASIIGSGYGFAIRSLDDGTFMVIYVTPGTPAEEAGVQVGDIVTEMNGTPMADAVSALVPYSGPFSTEQNRLYQQTRYIMRAPAGTEATFKLQGVNGAEREVTVTAVEERSSYSVTSVMRGFDYNALPVEFKILDSGVGYIRVNANYDDLNLILRLFERALITFTNNGVPGIIIDLRQNNGGSPLGLASYLITEKIPVSQTEYYSAETGKFEPEGSFTDILPAVNTYSFDKMVTLTGQACSSACEYEAYVFSQVPGMITMGSFGTGGLFGDVARGQFLLPEGISLQVPTGRDIMQDGSIFLEGVGVVPTIHVPITAENMLAMYVDGVDYELQAAEIEVLKPVGAGVEPESPATVMTADDTLAFLQGDSFAQLEDLSDESYQDDPEDGGVVNYTVRMPSSQQVAYAYGYCAADQATAEANFSHIAMAVTVDGVEVTADQVADFSFAPDDTSYCIYKLIGFDNWTYGQHAVDAVITIDAAISDGAGATVGPKAFTAHYDVYVAE